MHFRKMFLPFLLFGSLETLAEGEGLFSFPLITSSFCHHLAAATSLFSLFLSNVSLPHFPTSWADYFRKRKKARLNQQTSSVEHPSIDLFLQYGKCWFSKTPDSCVFPGANKTAIKGYEITYFLRLFLSPHSGKSEKDFHFHLCFRLFFYGDKKRGNNLWKCPF